MKFKGTTDTHTIASVVLVVILLIITAFLLTGCHTAPPKLEPTIVKVVETVEVKVPVPVRIEPPAELLMPLAPPLPVFVAPADPKASSALTAEGERLLRGLIEELLGRIAAWKAWATAKD